MLCALVYYQFQGLYQYDLGDSTKWGKLLSPFAVPKINGTTRIKWNLICQTVLSLLKDCLQWYVGQREFTIFCWNLCLVQWIMVMWFMVVKLCSQHEYKISEFQEKLGTIIPVECSSCKLLRTTFSPANRFIPLFYVRFCLKALSLTDINGSIMIRLNSWSTAL